MKGAASIGFGEVRSGYPLANNAKGVCAEIVLKQMEGDGDSTEGPRALVPFVFFAG